MYRNGKKVTGLTSLNMNPRVSVVMLIKLL